MEIHEYQNKRIFKSYNLPVLKGRVAYTPEEAQQIATEIGGTSWQVKAQIYDPNRATGNFVDAPEDKRGGVQIATSPEEVREITESMLTHLFLSPTMNYAGQVVNRVYIEETVEIEQSFGISLRLDLARNCYIFTVLANNRTEEFEISHMRPTLLYWYRVIQAFGVKGLPQTTLLNILRQMFNIFKTYDAIGVEINPLILTPRHKWVIGECRIAFDDEAIERFPDIMSLKEVPTGREREALAERYHFKYTPFNGNIACLVNGSGLGAATVELLEAHNGRPACLLDVGTEPTGNAVTRAFKLALSEPNVEGIFINIFGGLTRCDTIAQGLIDASKEISVGIPLVVRMDGTNANVGERLIFESRLPFVVIKQPEQAVRAIVQAVEESQL